MKAITVILGIMLAIFLLLIGPFVTVWAWNVLFGALYTIPYTWETWLAVVVLGVFLRAKVSVKKNS